MVPGAPPTTANICCIKVQKTSLRVAGSEPIAPYYFSGTILCDHLLYCARVSPGVSYASLSTAETFQTTESYAPVSAELRLPTVHRAARYRRSSTLGSAAPETRFRPIETENEAEPSCSSLCLLLLTHRRSVSVSLGVHYRRGKI